MIQHVGESEEEIFLRKKDEIKVAGKSFWLIKSFKAKTEQIQSICKTASAEDKGVYCIFVQASQSGGAQPTKTNSVASQFSSDSVNWKNIPDGIKVTGKLDKNSTALVLESLEIIDDNIPFDLWKYSDFSNDFQPIKMMQGASTVCCIKKDSNGMKSRHRKVIAVGKLNAPFAVWLK